MTTASSLILKPREGCGVVFAECSGGRMFQEFGGSNGRGLQNADRWRDLIKILHFTIVLPMFLTSENPRSRMALNMCLKNCYKTFIFIQKVPTVGVLMLACQPNRRPASRPKNVKHGQTQPNMSSEVETEATLIDVAKRTRENKCRNTRY